MMLARLASLVSAGKRRFQDLSEQEILAIAISSEEEDGRIYAANAARLRKD
jgi:rubrerythrin